MKLPNKGRSSTHSFIPVHWKPILVLLIITPILTELLTNNIPFPILFRPKLFLTLAILVYGPILLLRELAIRWNLRLTGYILLGLAYGIYNEGLFSRTFFKSEIANTSFINYGVVWNINLTWASVIIVFHTFYAFVFPVLIVYNIFPKAAAVPWMNKKWWMVLSTASIVYISYKFLKNAWPATPAHFVTLVACIIVFIMLSRRFKGGLIIDGKKPKLWLIAYGIVFVGTTFTVAAIIANARINFLYFLAYSVINLLFAALLLDKRYSIRSLLVFSLAAQFGFAASIVFVSTASRSETGIITGSTFAVVFASSLIKIIARSKKINLNKE